MKKKIQYVKSIMIFMQSIVMIVIKIYIYCEREHNSHNTIYYG